MNKEDYKKCLEELEPRIEWLQKNNKYFESFFMMSAIIERQMQCLIKITEDLVRSNLKNISCSYNLSKVKKIEKLTFGRLIDRLEIYFKGFKFINELKIIRDLRNDSIHGIFGKDLNQLEEEIIKNTKRVYKILADLADIETKILKISAEKTNLELKKVLDEIKK